MYESAPYLEEFYSRICEAAEKITSDYEIIFVNDGSPDNSFDIAFSLYEQDRRVKVINLSRNFGQHRALMAGLEHARGELIFQIDCDLEERPELLKEFYLELKNSSVDVVYGVRNTRKGRFFDRITGRLFYKLFNLFSYYAVPEEPLNARLMKRRYVVSLIQHKEREFFMAGLWAIAGFKQQPLTVDKSYKGESAYTFKRKIEMFVNAITSFSNKPLVYIFYLGCTISILSGTAALYLIIRRLFFSELLAGWPSLIVSLWLLGGLTLFCLGIIGIYLSKIFIETKQRPYTIIEEIYERSKESAK
jgi:putative glycosyltransferase